MPWFGAGRRGAGAHPWRDRTPPPIARTSNAVHAAGVRLALLVVSLCLVAGCYRSHQRRPSDAGVADVRAADAPRVDAPPPPPPVCVHRPFGEMQLTDFPDHGARSPDLVRTSSGLSTVFLESDGDLGHPFVSLVHTNEMLGAATTPLLVGEESHSWAEALVLSDETLAIAWLSDPGFVNRTALRRIDPFGRPFGDRVDVDLEGSSCLDLAEVGALVAVVYRGSIDGGGVAYLTFVDPIGGGRRSDRFELGSDDVSPQAAALDDASLLVVAARGTELSLERYTTAGLVEELAEIGFESALGRTVVARADDGTVAIATQTGETGMRGLRVMVLDRSFDFVTMPQVLVPDGVGVIGARIVATADGFVVSWGETLGDFGEGRFMVAHLRRDGLPGEARRVLFAGQLGSFAGPGLAATGPRTYLATSRPPDGGLGHAQLFLAGYACEPVDPCGAMDTRATSTGCSETSLLGYRWTGARCEPLESCHPCEGDDCDALASTLTECELDHVVCRG